jgi:thiol:disulfide interchange protein
VSVDRALRQHEVVVVSLVVPGARVDELAAAEAQAGAKLGGAGFLALNVLNEDVARALLNKLESVQDPSVLVVKRSGEVALELAGFVDRETVAQAAANAAS